MSDDITAEALARLREVCEAATPGKWVVDDGWEIIVFQQPDKVIPRQRGDVDFIAAAREWLPKLLDEVERLHDVDFEHTAMCRALGRDTLDGRALGDVIDLVAERDEARAEVERLEDTLVMLHAEHCLAHVDLRDECTCRLFDLRAENAALKAELERARAEVSTAATDALAVMDERDALRAELELSRAAAELSRGERSFRVRQQLLSERDSLRSELAVAREALEWIDKHADCECDPGAVNGCVGCTARAALATLADKGGV